MSATATIVPAKPAPRPRLIRRYLSRAFVALMMFYGGFLALGFVPVNWGYRQPSDDDRVAIFIRSNEIHTDLVLPTVNDQLGLDWRQAFPPAHYKSDVAGLEYVAIGWGNRAFFVDTPTWSEFKLTTALGALFLPSESVLHVEYVPAMASSEDYREIHITQQQYQQLAAFVQETIGQTDENGHAVLATNRSYAARDRFYLARGSYHLFNMCNQWTGRGLKRAGVPTGLWTPLKQQVLCWLPECKRES